MAFRQRLRLVPALWVAFLASCGGSEARLLPAPTALPQREATAGESLLPLLPAGAQVIIELDLDRARTNPVLGALARALIDQHTGSAPTVTDDISSTSARPGVSELSEAPLAMARTVVVASYRVGLLEAQSLTLLSTLVRGNDQAQARALGATVLADGVLAFGPPELIAQAQTQAHNAALSGAAPLSEELLALRARPMPSAASGALLRITAVLPFAAQLALARQTNLDPPPARFALWADAADDAAAILVADPDQTTDARTVDRFRTAMAGVVAALADDPQVIALGLSTGLRRAQISRVGSSVKVAVLIGPHRLQRAAQRATRWIIPAVSTEPSSDGVSSPQVPP
jgi:hypothetical protein